MQMYWDTSSVIYIEVIGCFGSVNIIHPRPGDPAETMFCVPAAFAYDSALLNTFFVASVVPVILLIQTYYDEWPAT